MTFGSVFVFFFFILHSIFPDYKFQSQPNDFTPHGRRHEWQQIKIKIESQTNFINFAYNFRFGLNATRTTTMADGIGSHSPYSYYRSRCALFNHMSSFIVFSTIVSMKGAEKTDCGEGIHRTEDKKYITVWSIFPLWFRSLFRFKN